MSYDDPSIPLTLAFNKTYGKEGLVSAVLTCQKT